MTLRIQCPACSRNFRISDELRDRTVECGACEHRFKVDDSTIVKRKEKFYPGEHRKPGLEGFGSAGSMANRPAAPVQFQTAAYNQTADADDVVPTSPQELVASAAGVAVLLLGGLIGFFGAQQGGMLQDTEVGKRVVLSFFIIIVGMALLLYGCRHRKKIGLLTGGILSAIVMVLALLMPVPRTIQEGGFLGMPTGGGPSGGGPDAPDTKTLAEVIEEVGYGPVKRAITTYTTSSTDGREKVAALWVPTMEERFKYQVQKYLHRKTGTDERPSFYRRDRGGLFVIEGCDLSLEQIAAIVERFGRVEEIYPEVRIIEIAVEGERLLEASPELMSKLTDKEHPAFYVRNLAELDHIDIDRVEDAANRLADAEPRRFRTEITQRLAELLAEEADAEFKGTVTRALMAWSEEGDGSEVTVAAAAQDILVKGEEMPRAMLDFLTARNPDVAVPIVEVLWKDDPSSWEPFVKALGVAAEETVANQLGSDDRAVQQSAARLLKSIGTRASLPALQNALAGANTELKVMLQNAIESIRNRP